MMYTTLTTLTLAATAAALPAANQGPQIPLSYAYGGYPRIQTNVSWGTPPQAPIPVIFDTGSVAFWTYGPKAIINDGSNYLATQGPCNKTVQKFFDWPKSTTHSTPINETSGMVYSYGGNGKLISAYQLINDTMSFTKTAPNNFKNAQVAISNFTLVRQLDDKCAADVNSFDQSILGVGPFGIGGLATSRTGPSFRTNLRDQGQVSADMLSMWMNKAPTSVRGTFKGTALFGQPLPKNAYSGNLVSIKQNPPKDGYIGYYSALPTLTVGGKKISSVDTSVENCLIDSGTGQDALPFNLTEASKYSGVFEYTSPEGFLIQAYNSSCDSIPQNATFDFSFPGATQGQSVVVKVPIRNYARGTSDGLSSLPKTICPLTFSLDNYGSCVLGAPFFTAAALQFDDDKQTISLAQGGVA